MEEKFLIIKKIILEYETEKINFKIALEKINQYSNIVIDLNWLNSYWKSMNLDDFVHLISISPIEDWKNLNDEQSLTLLTEILSNVADDAIIHRNTTALEKRYSKPTGTISDWIFHEDINDTNDLLKRLRIV